MLQDFLRDVFTFLRNGRKTLGGLQVSRIPGKYKKLKFINLFSIFSRACECARPVSELGADGKHRQTIGGFQVYESQREKKKLKFTNLFSIFLAHAGGVRSP